MPTSAARGYRPDAVGDKAVAAGVPVVVPEREPVVDEESALVEMRGEIAAGGKNEQHQGGCREGGERRDQRRSSRGRQRLAEQRSAHRLLFCPRRSRRRLQAMHRGAEALSGRPSRSSPAARTDGACSTQSEGRRARARAPAGPHRSPCSRYPGTSSRKSRSRSCGFRRWRTVASWKRTLQPFTEAIRCATKLRQMSVIRNEQ